MKGIDVAKWNGNINWNLVKAEGVEFAILKVINKQNKIEDAFERNYKGATGVGIPTDVYNYLYTTTETDAVKTAYKVVEVIKGKDIDTVYADVEDACLRSLGINLINILNAYKNVIEKAGYNFEIYTGLSFYNTYIKPYASKIDCRFWIARYNKGDVLMPFSENPDISKKPCIVHELSGWQYTSHGRINGINGNVDLNIKYTGSEIEKELPTIRKGSKGYYVGYVQEKLISLGYNCGSVDRSFGIKTELAVKEFQKRNNLKVDGVVGPNTWKRLNSTHPVMNPIAEYSLKTDGNKKISANFTVKEFACKDGTDSILIDREFVADKLQKIRNHFGASVTINSGYRTDSYNKKVGGAANSYHVKGQAFDIVVKGKTPAEVAMYAYSIGIPGIIQYNTFVHVDSREEKYFARNDNGKVIKVNKF